MLPALILTTLILFSLSTGSYSWSLTLTISIIPLDTTPEVATSPKGITKLILPKASFFLFPSSSLYPTSNLTNPYWPAIPYWYAQTVGPAYLGAPTHPGGKNEVKVYADI